MTSTIDDMDRVGHACLVPDSDDHLWEATATWVAGGLAAGERVVYFEDETSGAMLGRLADDRVAVDSAIADGGLVIVPTAETRRACAFPVDDIVDIVRTEILKSEVGGWPGIRLAGESAGMLSIGGLRKVVEYERAIDALLAEHPAARMLCRYDRRFFDDEAVAAMRALHTTELVIPAIYDDTLLRVTGTWPTTLRFAGEIDLSNRPQIRRVLDRALDAALRSPSAATDITIDLSSLRFIDVGGAVELVHAAESFPETHRMVLVGARPRVLRVLDRCGAPFAARLDVLPRGEDR
ncbi:MAG: MEDS domain-containing protein [Pseudonocardiales bacterium]|nr:MEDS domain-containing protein [Pseudonocardiales bacterium]